MSRCCDTACASEALIKEGARIGRQRQYISHILSHIYTCTRRYPHLAVGAVATSAPVLAQSDFLKYHEVVASSLQTAKGGSECTRVINNATAQIQHMLTTASGRHSLATIFRVCTSDLSDPLDAANFMATLAGNLDGWLASVPFSQPPAASHLQSLSSRSSPLHSLTPLPQHIGVVQYNGDNRAFEGAGNPPTIDNVCAILTQGGGTGDDLAKYVALNDFMLNATGQGCTDVDYQRMVAEMRNISLAGPAAEGGRQWVYQTCVEFGFYQTSEAVDQPFGDMFPLAFSLQQCQDIYGINRPDVNWTNANYGWRWPLSAHRTRTRCRVTSCHHCRSQMFRCDP